MTPGAFLRRVKHIVPYDSDRRAELFFSNGVRYAKLHSIPPDRSRQEVEFLGVKAHAIFPTEDRVSRPKLTQCPFQALDGRFSGLIRRCIAHLSCLPWASKSCPAVGRFGP